MFRTLKPNEIELRVGTCNQKGFSLLLYKDARCDQNILDETVGAMNWKRAHTRDNANCIVSIYDKDKGEWVSKEDTGTESFTEKEKGLASDSFKRACVNWGIGRELYTSPFIWINGNVEQNNKGKFVPKDNYDKKLKVTDISYDDSRNVNHLVIKDDNNKAVYTFPKSYANEPKEDPEATKKDKNIEKDRPRLVNEISDRVETYKLDADKVYAKIGVSKLSDIATERLPGMINWLDTLPEEKRKELM